MDTVRPVVIGLTAFAVILFVCNLLAKKGTTAHKIRGHLVGISSLVSVVINTLAITQTRGLVWDVPFIIHFSFGTLTLLGLIATSVSGYLLTHTYTLIDKTFHRKTATIAGCLYLLTILAAAGLHVFRN